MISRRRFLAAAGVLAVVPLAAAFNKNKECPAPGAIFAELGHATFDDFAGCAFSGPDVLRGRRGR